VSNTASNAIYINPMFVGGTFFISLTFAILIKFINWAFRPNPTLFIRIHDFRFRSNHYLEARNKAKKSKAAFN